MTETETKPMLSFPEAIKSCLRQYVGFAGRATRAEYWWWVLGTVVVSFLLGFLDGIIFGFEPDDTGVFGILFFLATLLPGLAVTARRLHDIDRTGWWQLVWHAIALVAWMPVVVSAFFALVVIVISDATGLPFDMMWTGEGFGDVGILLFLPIVISSVVALSITIPLVVWAIYWMTRLGQTGPNQYGLDPRAVDPVESTALLPE